MKGTAPPSVPRGSGTPLAMMGLVLAAWVGGRAVLWESPFPAPASLIPVALAPLIAKADAPPAPAAQTTSLMTILMIATRQSVTHA